MQPAHGVPGCAMKRYTMPISPPPASVAGEGLKWVGCGSLSAVARRSGGNYPVDVLRQPDNSPHVGLARPPTWRRPGDQRLQPRPLRIPQVARIPVTLPHDAAPRSYQATRLSFSPDIFRGCLEHTCSIDCLVMVGIRAALETSRKIESEAGRKGGEHGRGSR
jgi:hypothetical protein